MRFILRALAAALGFWVASRTISGVRVADLTNLLEAGLMLGILNALVRPVLILLTLPLTILTLGLFLLVINGLTVWLVTVFIPGVHIRGLWPALLASVVISLVSWAANVVIGGLNDRSD